MVSESFLVIAGLALYGRWNVHQDFIRGFEKPVNNKHVPWNIDRLSCPTRAARLYIFHLQPWANVDPSCEEKPVQAADGKMKPYM